MPELGEVEFYRREWAAHTGDCVEQCLTRPEKKVFRGVETGAMESGLAGSRFASSAAHGKQMIFRFGADQWLGVHLGMTGRLFAAAPDGPRGRHDHLILRMRGGVSLVFSDFRLFGRIRYARTAAPPEWWSRLPPEVLSDAFDFEGFSGCLRRCGRSPVKAVLLRQDMFPGVGNWMADEILWRARIRPETPAGAIGPRKQRALYASLREVCADALRVIGDGWQTPPQSWLFPHRWRDGGLCPKTGRPLRRTKVGGRTTCWSPSWQTYRGREQRFS